MDTRDELLHLEETVAIDNEIIRDLHLRAEQAEARCKRLEDALRKIANLYWQDAPCPQEMRDMARKALEDK